MSDDDRTVRQSTGDVPTVTPGDDEEEWVDDEEEEVPEDEEAAKRRRPGKPKKGRGKAKKPNPFARGSTEIAHNQVVGIVDRHRRKRAQSLLRLINSPRGQENHSGKYPPW